MKTIKLIVLALITPFVSHAQWIGPGMMGQVLFIIQMEAWILEQQTPMQGFMSEKEVGVEL